MKKEKRSSRLSLKQNYFFYLMILPTLLYLLIFQIYPIIETVRISFTNWLLTDQSSGGYVGFANYTRLFTQDSNFWTLFRNSVFWVLGSTVLQYFFAIPISVLLNQKMRARGLWRGLMMVPWVTPMVIAGLIWRWMFEGNYGLFNQLLGTDIVWLADSSTVWICLLIVSTWKGIPYATLMFLAGLQGIPGDLYEAAYVDGAGPLLAHYTASAVSGNYGNCADQHGCHLDKIRDYLDYDFGRSRLYYQYPAGLHIYESFPKLRNGRWFSGSRGGHAGHDHFHYYLSKVLPEIYRKAVMI